MQPDGSDREMIVRLEEPLRNWDFSMQLSGSDPGEIVLDLEDFIANDGASEIDLVQLNRLSLFVLPGSGGNGKDSLYFDNIAFRFFFQKLIYCLHIFSKQSLYLII